MAPCAAVRNPAADRVMDGEPDSLVAKAARGDDRAFAALVRHHDRVLRALAYQLLGDTDRMDDALQEILCAGYRALPGLRGDAQAGTWLQRIVYNACMDDLQRGRRRAASSYDELPEQADRWTWLVVAAYTQLRLARGLVDDLRRPWERPREPALLTPSRVRRGFRLLSASIGTPAQPPKSDVPGPGRPKGTRRPHEPAAPQSRRPHKGASVPRSVRRGSCRWRPPSAVASVTTV